MENIKNKLKAELSAYGRVHDCLTHKNVFTFNYRYGGNARLHVENIEDGFSLVRYYVYGGCNLVESYFYHIDIDCLDKEINSLAVEIMKMVSRYSNAYGLNVA